MRHLGNISEAYLSLNKPKANDTLPLWGCNFCRKYALNKLEYDEK